jgi:4-hydroxyphenylpyruvate dioxygenase-like putative hemolysin
MPVYKFEHLHLVSADPEKTAQFYEKFFGAQRLWKKEVDGKVAISTKMEGIRFSIIEHKGTDKLAPTNTTGIDHLGITTDDIYSSVATLKAAGVKFHTEPYVIGPGITVSYLWGPDNVLVELYEVKPQLPQS